MVEGRLYFNVAIPDDMTKSQIFLVGAADLERCAHRSSNDFRKQVWQALWLAIYRLRNVH
jgi:hypothetical protein